MDFTGVRVLVVGDVMLDHYIAGQVSRISPEAPVPVACVRKRWTALGGAANVARNLARLGIQVALTGLAGRDEAGEALRRELAAEGIDDGLVYSATRSTTRKTRIIAQGQQLLRLDEEVIAPPHPEERAALRGKILELLFCQRLEEAKGKKAFGAVVLSDYGKGVLLKEAKEEEDDAESGGLCALVITAARERGIPVLVDPKGGQWRRYAGAQCVTPNSAEFVLACGLEAGDAPDQRERETLASRLRKSYGLERILLTRGAKGMVLFAGDEPPCYIRAAVREVADVSGAGDTVIATLAACVAKGLDWKESVRVANIAAGVAVGKMGTAPVSLAELNQALRESADNPKLYGGSALLEKLEEWRRRNESIVFTNGCFDLLHPGHISLIRECVALGDRLVVGLNSDASVRRLKGPGRPVQNEQSRALLLAALQGVDAVVLFEEDTPLELIRRVRPDVLVKGSDYTVETMVGADLVREYGGRVHLARLVDGCSTTNLVRRMGSAL
ncbi:MAG: D-glycero-beta-D-manno-heptose 1-phosphate adenylyltransferase [Firmicutes bacterium]|nr:D-glycero-beta-D-manno-heptose 1-phosphate adenylyltransferase [Bacillota bacterium]